MPADEQHRHWLSTFRPLAEGEAVCSNLPLSCCGAAGTAELSLAGSSGSGAGANSRRRPPPSPLQSPALAPLSSRTSSVKNAWTVLRTVRIRCRPLELRLEVARSDRGRGGQQSGSGEHWLEEGERERRGEE